MVLAAAYVVAERNAATRGRVAVAGQVDFWGLAIAKRVEECYVYIGISAGGTCLCEGAFIAILAPVDGDSAGPGGRDKG